MEGRKFDEEKPDWSLLPAAEVEQVVKVLQYGAKKYARDNWQIVPGGGNRYFSAAMRHLWAWRKGETHDRESGYHHITHAICSLLFCLWFESHQNVVKK